jgi:hypothetical protein
MERQANSRLLAAAAIVVAALLAAASAKTITVDDDRLADFNNIQAAIDDANDGDTVVVGEGTYLENVRFDDKNITLTSTDPNDPAVVAATIIDGNSVDSVVTFSGAEDYTCVLRGFTITNGRAPEGGGIYGNGTLATIEYNIITNNAAAYGGGLSDCHGAIRNNTISENYNVNYYNRPDLLWHGHGGGLRSCHGTIVNNWIGYNTAHTWGGGLDNCDGRIEKNVVTNNSASMDGGGLHGCDGAICNNTITNNSGRFGGGLGTCDGTVQHNSTVSNVASYRGGAISGCGGTIKHNIIKNNWVLGTSENAGGGGLYACYGTVAANTIVGNSARRGGGLFACGEVLYPDCPGYAPIYLEATIYNNLIIANSADEDGGGLSWCYGTIENNTICGNHAGTEGAGLSYCGGSITNCVIWGNTSGGSGQQVSGCAPDFCAIPCHCCIEGWMNGGAGNIAADPSFADTSCPDPNEWDLHLNSQAGRYDPNIGSWVEDDVTSPCIDAGDPASPIGEEPFPNGGRINMGAYGGTAEASKSYFGEPLCETIVAGDVNGDCKVDAADFAIMAFHWLCEQQ